MGLTAMTLALSGCETHQLIIKPFGTGGEGAPYSLLFTQYDTTIKWRVTSCGRRTQRTGERANAVPVRPFSVVADITADPSLKEDPSRRWLLDLSSVDSWLNTTDLSINYENGHFKSFNATVEDKTADIVESVAIAAAKIATVAAAADNPLHPDACADLVERADQATQDVQAKTKALNDAKSHLTALQASGASDRVQKQAQAAILVATDNLATATAGLDKALKAVTFEQKLKWPLTGGSAPSETLPLPADAIAQWHAEKWPDAARIAVTLQLLLLQADGAYKPAGQENEKAIDDKVSAGRIPVRIARPGTFVASLSSPDDNGPAKEILRKDATVMQSGDIIYVPVEYRWPHSNVTGFGVDASGNLTTVAHKQTAAPAGVLAKAAQSVSEQAGSIFPSELDKLKAENDLLTAKKDHADLEAALNPTPQSAEQVQLNTINSELTLNKAKLELALTNQWLAKVGGN